MKNRQEIFVVIAILAILAGLVVVSIEKGRERARRISCASNLKSIGLSLKQYSMDNDDFFPNGNGAKGMDLLISESYCTDYKIYTCPSSETELPKDNPTNLNEKIFDYVYRGGLIDSDAADSSIMWDKSLNHHNYGSILFIDGHVLGYAGSDWQQKIK